MKQYDSYKDSGIYFLPKLPSNWEIRKGKYLFKEENRPVRSDDEIVTCFRDGQVTLRKNRRTEGFTNSLKEIGYQGVRRGDLVIHNMDAFAGAIGISDSDGKATPVYACCTPKSEEVSQYYYCYLLRYLARNGFILSLAKGIRERSTDFRFNDFKELYLPVPTRKEQDAIVAYLDSATSKIDEAIAQQQKMIDLLNERKQIIINNAVTKGLDPNVKMKPSGIDWIGDIPEHWEVIRIKYLLNESKERSESGKEEPLSMSQIYGLIPTKNMDTVPNMASTFVGAKKVKEGDLVFNKLKAHLGVFNVSKYEGLVSPDYAVYTSTGIANLSFLEYIFKTPACIHEFIKLITGVGAGLSRLYTSDLYSIYCALPSIEEQKKICDFIDERTKKIKETIINFQKQISILQERKQIIINDVVTGKVKVV